VVRESSATASHGATPDVAGGKQFIGAPSGDQEGIIGYVWSLADMALAV
jgi:hypothetical protein